MKSLFTSLVVLSAPIAASAIPRSGCGIPPPPEPEPISLKTLALPPAIADSAPVGSCDENANPNETGCIGITTNFQSGGFSPDGNHVYAAVTFVGAPAAPHPASIYNGSQLILVKADDTTFPNGDAWKCLTCGLPHDDTDLWDYPQAFSDGKRVLAGTRVVDCGEHDLWSERCTADTAAIHPIRWQTNADDSGPGGVLRELRLHPDNVHLGFNAFIVRNGALSQDTFYSRLSFNPAPETGSPAAPRYDLVNVTRFLDPDSPLPVDVDGDRIVVNQTSIKVGELRGFSGDGKEVIVIGYPLESNNFDAYAFHLTTGSMRRLTSHPEYIDPLDISRHDGWIAIMDTRGTDRNMWLSGMRYIPPLTDLVSTSLSSATRNNGRRRFFRPYLLDRHGDRGEYFGQRINDEGSGEAGSGDYNDPEWNGRADPKFSFDGTKIVYWDEQTFAPACGGLNPLPCYPSKEPGGIRVRIVVATLTSRQPRPPPKVEEASDIVPWGTPYVPGAVLQPRRQPLPGNYTLFGEYSGTAEVSLGRGTSSRLNHVSVRYSNFSDDGKVFLSGSERVTVTTVDASTRVFDVYSDLTQAIGSVVNTRKTGPGGIQIVMDNLVNNFQANGTLVTTIDGKEYHQPQNFT